MKSKQYQTITFADITLTAKAQEAISCLHHLEEKIICDNLGEVALRLCEADYCGKAPEILELVHSVLLAKNYLSLIMTKEYED